MIADRPFLLDTDLGTLGVILSEPEGPPRSSTLLLQGGGTRSGVNRLWTRTARALAARGIVGLRLDYPGHGDSLSARTDLKARIEAAAHALSWLRQRTGMIPFSLMGNCGGAHVAIRLAARYPPRALALVNPYLRRPPPAGASARRLRGWSIRVRRRVAPTRRGRASPDPALLRELREVLSATPTLVLVGERDAWAPNAELVRRLGTHVNVQIAPGVELSKGKTLREAQEETLTRLVSWFEEPASAYRTA
jgi:pimeloyl-ACP methyl ester carboxylesterase